MHKSRILCVTITVLLLEACRPTSVPHNNSTPLTEWAYTDVRALDPVDVERAEQDILALYIRSSASTQPRKLEIRLDFLSLSMRNNPDLYLAIDHSPGGTHALPLRERNRPAIADIEWDTLLVFPASAHLRGFDSQGETRPGLALQLWQDPVQDVFVLSLNLEALPSGLINWQIQAFTASANSQQILDRVEPVFLDAQPPPPVSVLFAFWNTFPAYTPAQALRRWSGAHTGPLGGSHGLAFLLRASQRFHIPLTLLDLNTPLALSALDYAGGMDVVRSMATHELLILPDNVPISFGSLESATNTAPAWLFTRDSTNNIHFAINLELPSSRFLYGFPQSGIPAHYLGLFSHIHQQSETLEPLTVNRAGHLRVISIPSQLPNDQATLDGPSIPVRKALIDTALAAETTISNEIKNYLVLGGDLTTSTWGEPRRARATFEYIRAHPWIKPLDAYSLLTTKPSGLQNIKSSDGSYLRPSTSLYRINVPERGRFAQAAWHNYLALMPPVSTSAIPLSILRQNYLGQMNALLTASDWEYNSQSISSCQEDPDLDGEPECVLASENIYTIFEVEEGSLSYAFVRNASGIHQVIGPSSQLAVGLGEPTTWDLKLGERADPSVIMGAFTDSDGPYLVNILENTLVLRSENTEKKFALTPTGLTFNYSSQAPKPLQIPIILDPWERFQPGWGDRYTLELMHHGARWSLAGGAVVEIMADTPVEANAFIDTRSRMGSPENPNYDYPQGHYLPFPLAIINVQAKPDLRITITLKD